MCGGGGQAPQTYSPMEEAQAQIAIDQANAQRAAEQAARDKAAAEAAQAQKTAIANQARNNALSNAQAYGKSQYGTLGIGDVSNDPYGIMSQYNSALQQAYNKASTVDNLTDYSSYFSPTIFDDTLSNVRTGQRNTITKAINDYTPTGFANNYWADTADDTILNSILGSQQNDAKTALNAAQQRGQLTGNAFTRAMADLNTNSLGANSKLQAAGATVLDKYRTALNDAKNSGLTNASNWNFTNTYSPDQYKSSLQSLYNNQQGLFEGDLRNATSGLSLFDTDSLIANALAKSGLVSTTSSTPKSSLSDTSIDDILNNRTSANQGVF